MKKIIFVANVDCGKEMSGGSTIYIQFLKNWGKNFFTYFYGSRGTIRRLQKENIKNIEYIETDFHDNPDLYSVSGIFRHFWQRTVYGIKLIKQTRNIIRDIDYIYSASDFYPDFFPAFYAKLLNKKIKWISGYYLIAPSPFAKDSPYKGKNRIRGFLYWLMQRPTYYIAKNFADFVFVTSQPDAQRFVTRKVIVVQGGVDTAFSRKYLRSADVIPVKQRKYDACFMGRFHYQKGVLELMDIWKKVCETKKDAKLAMIGSGSLEPGVKEKIKRFGLEKNVELLGFRDGLKKSAVFKQSKIVVHPAIFDSGGMAAAEGMSWGLPGVSFDLEALKTYYPRGMLKARRGDISDFSRKIIKLLKDKKLYEKTSKEAVKLITDVWDWKKRSTDILNKIQK